MAAEIVGRTAPGNLRVVSPADFRTGEWRALEGGFSTDDFVPYCLDVQERRAFYVKAGGVRAIERAKLQYVHLREHATTLLSVPWEYGRLTQAPQPPVCFAFSVGRCGSTLVVEAMRGGGALSLSEPDFFTQAVATYLFEGPLYPQYRNLVEVVRNLTADLLFACGGRSSEPALIKLRTQCCKAPSLIVNTEGPRQASLFIIREFKSWAASTLRASALTPKTVVDRYVEGLRCLRWLKRNTDCYVLRSEDLVADPQHALCGISTPLGFSIDAARLKKTLRQDAQEGTPLARKRLSERQIEPGALDSAARLWATTRSKDLLTELGLSDYC